MDDNHGNASTVGGIISGLFALCILCAIAFCLTKTKKSHSVNNDGAHQVKRVDKVPRDAAVQALDSAQGDVVIEALDTAQGDVVMETLYTTPENVVIDLYRKNGTAIQPNTSPTDAQTGQAERLATKKAYSYTKVVKTKKGRLTTEARRPDNEDPGSRSSSNSSENMSDDLDMMENALYDSTGTTSRVDGVKEGIRREDERREIGGEDVVPGQTQEDKVGGQISEDGLEEAGDYEALPRKHNVQEHTI